MKLVMNLFLKNAGSLFDGGLLISAPTRLPSFGQWIRKWELDLPVEKFLQEPKP